MEIFAVGGVVRDQLMGIVAQDIDYVVVGSTPQQMIEKGFIQVGSHFPVFLHPKTKFEYALARKEKKIGPGYTAFDCDSGPDVTLEEDLLRRDLTINAMARKVDSCGGMSENIIDPYNGRKDLQNKILKHVSIAFCEDPVRVLRLARFAARFPDFSIHLETYRLAQNMVLNGEINSLVPERIWQEMTKAMFECKPSRFFQVLYELGVLRIIFPELDELWSQNIENASVECYGEKTMKALEKACFLNADLSVRWAVLIKNLGNIFRQPAFRNQQKIFLVQQACQRFRVPNKCKDLALLTIMESENIYHARKISARALLSLLERCDAFRRSERFFNLILVCQASIQEQSYTINFIHEIKEYFETILLVLKRVRFQGFNSNALSNRDGNLIRKTLFFERLQVLENFMMIKR